MAETVIRSRIDSNLKLEAQALLDRFGLSMSDAIRLFLNQVVLEKGLPFQIRLPKEAAKEHDSWFRSQVECALKEADDSATKFVSHDEVRSGWAEKRKALEARIAAESRV